MYNHHTKKICYEDNIYEKQKNLYSSIFENLNNKADKNPQDYKIEYYIIKSIEN